VGVRGMNKVDRAEFGEGEAMSDLQRRHGKEKKDVMIPAGSALLALKYMRAFAAAYPDREFVQGGLAQIPWRTNVTIIEKVKEPEARLSLWALRSGSMSCRELCPLNLRRLCRVLRRSRRSWLEI
jgi:hypothetical protein